MLKKTIFAIIAVILLFSALPSCGGGNRVQNSQQRYGIQCAVAAFVNKLRLLCIVLDKTPPWVYIIAGLNFEVKNVE